MSKSRSHGRKKRENLFTLFANNLKWVKSHPNVRVVPDLEDSFVCPICFKVFTREGLKPKYDDQLTLEDVPPKALGGNVKTLTCKLCNNNAGSIFEKDVKKWLITEDFLKGLPNSSIEATFAPGENIKFPAIFTRIEENTIDIKYFQDRAHPDNLKRLKELEQSRDEFNIQFEDIGGYKITNKDIGLLRIAYLLAFSTFGYGFLINYFVHRVRHQILNPDEKILPDYGIIPTDFSDSNLGISVLTEPKELRSFLVVFKLVTENSVTRHGIILPGPTEPGLNIYKYLEEAKEAKRPVQFRFSKVPELDYVQDEELAYASHSIWKLMVLEHK